MIHIRIFRSPLALESKRRKIEREETEQTVLCSCIGQVFALNEERIVLSALLKKFVFTLDESHPIELEPQMSKKIARA